MTNLFTLVYPWLPKRRALLFWYEAGGGGAEYIICRVHVSVNQIISFTLPHGFCLISVGVLFCFVSHLGDLAFGSKSYNIHHLLTWDFSNLIHFNTASRDSEGSAFIRTVRSEIEIVEIWKCLFILHKMDGVSLQNPTMQVSLENKHSLGHRPFAYKEITDFLFNRIFTKSNVILSTDKYSFLSSTLSKSGSTRPHGINLQILCGEVLNCSASKLRQQSLHRLRRGAWVWVCSISGISFYLWGSELGLKSSSQ